ncbi:hypothetical protein [Candidatus Bacteroides intestinigallinarum]|uniref:hypothetical protein n=1 Tax=Candidatus Bacteroides intestinigallinarum TaxID=2838470 RepID=UPI0022E943F4|nr:hypothetical protein [Candidatus Bacteroides intestinigallinarum]
MKVIYVYLIFRKKGYAFGSLSAVFDYLDEEEVGIKKTTLLHRSDAGTITTQRTIISKLTLLRSKKCHGKEDRDKN